MSPDLRVRLGDVELANPIMTAAGCAGAGRELAQFFDVARIGAVVTKSVMLEPRAGWPAPRMAETPSGMLSAIGLQGPGIDVFLQRDLPWLLSRGGRAVVSVAGGGSAEYAELAGRLSEAPGVSVIEVNLSSPNLADRGRHFTDDPAAAAEAVRAVRSGARSDIPVFAKLSPDVPDLVGLAGACVEAGADGLSMINTVRGMSIDTATMRPAVAGGMGGVSGPAIRPIAVACVYEVHAALPDVPIIGMGGVRTGSDALEFVLAGASAVAVGTVIFHDPSACVRILREFEEALGEHGVARVSDLVGAAHRPMGAALGR
ncbi:dihydroorotate dehydrogenase (NAD+) catalytic subunit [Spinactinospora alkalitolerans]|uniref:Dihydroorotate dehydrogenase n=1 Tax=Spinactinospora alkalitolerans TaxID=687207 RepID=A0A852TZC4_9ACTN|nr:dihydroorotate dehydrogenase [Spinactinospora alkalitolerans]NYE48685.1 dihydroorotate dehydrogenase (NAD+) catalytic subunit [Spinactinospora alkalitolerans]